MLTVQLFGPGLISLDGTTAHLHSARTLALLAYLAVEGPRPHARSRLASLLWPHSSESAARQSLRQALHSLKGLAAGRFEGWLHAGRDEAWLADAPQVSIDVRRFIACVESSRIECWTEAASLARAPLLEGRDFEDAEAFDAWLQATRERLELLAVRNLDRLVMHWVAQAEWDRALRHALEWRSRAPLNEAASRHIFRILSALGDAAGVDEEWHRLSAALEAEIGVAPCRETSDLYRALRATAAVSSRPTRATSPAPATSLADSLVRAARAAEKVYAFGHALELYERALQVLAAATPASPERCCAVLLRKSAALDRLGRRTEQLATLDEALHNAHRTGQPATVAEVLLHQAGARSYVGDSAAAAEAAREALDIHGRMGDAPGQAEALRELGFAYWRADRHADALACGEQALDLHRRLADVGGEATALHNLAELHRGLGSPARALALYQAALQLHWSVRNHEGEILTLFGMAHALQQQGHLQGAKRRYESALELSERHAEQTMRARALHALAVLCRDAGELDEGFAYMKRATDVDRTINYAHALTHDLVDLSVFHLLRGERAEARAALQEAVVWCDYTGDAAGMAKVASRLARLDEDAPDALDFADRGFGIKSHLPLPEGKVYCEFASPLAVQARRDARASTRPNADA